MEILSKKRLEACILLEAQESLYAMSNVYTDIGNITIQINPTEGRIGEPYFKVYNTDSVSTSSYVARISFDVPKYIIHKDSKGKQSWFMNASERKNLVSVLTANNYSVWKKLIANWNKEKYGITSRRWSFFTSKVKSLLNIANKQKLIDYAQSSDKLEQQAYKFMLSVFNIDNIKQFKARPEEHIITALSRLKECMPIDKPMPDYMQLVE